MRFLCCLGYLLLAFGSRPVQTGEICGDKSCCCQFREKIFYDTISMSLKRQEVVNVTCIDEEGANREFIWEAMSESKTHLVTRKSRRTRLLTIRGGASINATQSNFTCRPQHHTESCCRVVANIQPNKNVPTQTPTMKTSSLIETSYQNASHPNRTSFPNVTSGAFTSLRTATISATVSATAVLLLSVGAAAIMALKRKQLSDQFTANDSSDNLAYSKELQVWNGSKIIPTDCLFIGKSLGERNIDNRLEKLQN